MLRALLRTRSRPPATAPVRRDVPLSAAARKAYAALDRRPAPVDGAPAVESCVGDRRSQQFAGYACSTRAAWFTELGYLCDKHYVGWLHDPEHACVYGFAEVREGTWHVFGFDADGRAAWTYTVDHVLEAQRRRAPRGGAEPA